MNIVVSAASKPGIEIHPVVYTYMADHYSYGEGNLLIFNGVNLLSLSLDLGTAIICVHFNYHIF